MKLYIVVDQKGFAKPFNSFAEANTAFENMVKGVRIMNSNNMSLREKFIKVQDSDVNMKQYKVSYTTIKKDGSRFYNHEIYSLHTLDI